MDKPISVIIAEYMGCEPVYVEGNEEESIFTHWCCSCKEHGHCPRPSQAHLWLSGYEAWLTDAGSMKLLTDLASKAADHDYIAAYWLGNIISDTITRRYSLPKAIATNWIHYMESEDG